MARESLVSSPRHFWLPQTLVLPNNTQFQLSADLRVWLSELRHLYDFYGRFRFESSESESDSLMFLENKSDVKNYYNSVKRYIKDLNFDSNISKDRVSDKNCKKSLCEEFTDSVYSKDIGIDVISVKPIKAEGIKPVVIHDSYLKHSISTRTCVNMNSALQNSFLYSLDNVTWKSNPLYSSTLGGSCTNKSIFKMMCEEALNSAAAMCIESLLPREKSSTFRNKRKGIVFDSDCIYGSDEQCLNVGKIVSSKFNFDVVYSSELEVNTQNLCKCLCHGSFLSSECAKPQYSTSDNQIPLNDIGDSMQELLILLSDDDHSEEKQLFQLEFCTLIEELDVLANENSSEILYSNLEDLGNKPIHRINIFDDGYSGRPKPPVRKKKTLTKNKSLNLVDSCNNHLIGDSTSLIDNESECSVSLAQNLESFSSSDGSIRWESPADEMYVTFESHRYGSESDLASSDVTFATVNEEEFPSDSVSVGLSGTVLDSGDGASSSQPDSEGCPELKPPLIGVITEVEGASEVLQRDRKSSVSSDIVAWKRDIFFSALDDSDEDYYIAMGPNKDGWFSSSDNEGRVYFFEENSNESSWTLPEASPLNNNKSSVEEQRGTTSSQQPSLPIAVPLAVRNLNRTAKSRSMVLTDRLVNVWKTTLRLSGKSKLNKMWRVVLSTGHTVAARCRSEDNSALPHSVPRNWPQLWDGHMCVLKEGPLNRTKITENGKRLRKNWATTHVVLTELFLLFFKDSKAFAAMKSSGARPELCVDLNGAFIDREDKVSSRKNVYMLNTVLGLQVLIQCDNHNIAEQWFAAIHLAIKNLPLGFDNSNRGLKGGRDLSRSESNTLDEPKKGSRIGRSKSVKLKHKDESMEDLSVSPADRQIKIRERLKKFFHRRPTMESLVKKGIWKDEPVFGCYLEQVCGAEFPRVPLFVQRCIHCIEQSEENLKTDGLYRASGNLSQVQKIRLQVDQNNYAILEQEEDVHVLTGALKLFFRELKQPLLPFHFFNKALKASTNHNQKEKLKDFREIVKALPMPNHDTLKFLLQHLLRVTEYEEFNRMEIPNLAIVFGPTLMWSEQESLNMAFDLMQQNLVIGYFLAEFDQIFR